MKSDDDTFVNVPNLLHVLLGGTLPIYNHTYFFHDDVSVNVLSPKSRIVKNKHLLLGCKFCGSKPIVDVKSKWFTPNYMYNQKLYPDYLSGSSYLMSFESARRLYKASLTTPLLHLEDVYLTGIVANKIKLKRQHHPMFFYSSWRNYCSTRGMLTQHQMTPAVIEIAYEFVMDSTKKCAVPGSDIFNAKLAERKKCHE